MRTIQDIIAACGGPKKIAEAVSEADPSAKPLTEWAVRKWHRVGIVDRHWPVIRSLMDISPAELHEANECVRAAQKARIAANTPSQGDRAA